MMSKKEGILVYGAGGHCKVVLDILKKDPKYDIVGLVEDNEEKHGQEILGCRVLGGFDLLKKKDDYRDKRILLAIGDNYSRKEVWSKLNELGYDFNKAIHSSAYIGEDVDVGPGTVIMANSVVNSGAELGRNVIVNTGATVDHDCVIGDFVHLSPGTNLAGNVIVGELSHIGIGSSVKQGVRIGNQTIIGAGAVVINDISNKVTAVGVPAKVVNKKGEQLI